MSRICWPTIIAILLAGSAKAAPPPRERVFGLVIAHNGSIDPALADLHYADDDGARFYELLSAVDQAQVELLSHLDDQSQATFSYLTAAAHPPTRVELNRAMQRLTRGITSARRSGHRTVFYFYFAGHGGVGSDGEGYLHLAADRLGRSDLYREVISASKADVNHVIIDACNSFTVVEQRGHSPADSRTTQLAQAFLEREALVHHYNTGVFVSAASEKETHEWSRIRSGVFSHELLSALWGAADIDGDSTVSYAEAEAFVASANIDVKDPRAQLNVYARAPRTNVRAPLLDLRSLLQVSEDRPRPSPGRIAGFLELPQEMADHFYLEDDRGVRYAEFNKSSEQPVRVALLDRPAYFLRSPTAEAVVQTEQPGDVDASGLTFSEIPAASRGSIEQSFRRELYRTPFGRSFALGYAAAAERSTTESVPLPLPTPAPPQAWYRSPGFWKWSMAGTGVVALGLGGAAIVQDVLIGQRIRETQTLTMREADALRQEQAAWLATGVGALCAAAISGVAAGALFAIDTPPESHAIEP